MFKRLVTMLGCCLTVISCYADQGSQISGNINHLINKTNPNINIGIIVKDLDTDKVLYQRNAERSFVPASNLKLYSNAAALMVLGPNYHFPTSIYTDASNIGNGTLQGNVYVTFSGDPSLTHSDVENLVAQLHSAGISRITGDVVIVPANYTNEGYGPGWILKDTALAYGAPVSPVIIDENVVKIIIRPSANGYPARVSVDEPSGVIRIENHLKTQRKKSCITGAYVDNRNQLRVNGCISPRSGTAISELALKNPLAHAQSLLSVLFKRMHIAVGGTITVGNLKQGAHMLVTHQSVPLAQIVVDTLKPSDNLYADSLYMKAAEVYLKQTANWNNGAQVLKQVLQDYAGVNLSNATIVDGCGLSRYNHVTPLQTLGLLTYLYSKFPLSYEFISALPVAGRDGTLVKRMRAKDIRGRLRAKTGAMTGVASLSGYLESANHHTLAFSIMINRVKGDGGWYGAKYRQLEDKICEYLMKLVLQDSPIKQGPSRALQQLPYEIRNG